MRVVLLTEHSGIGGGETGILNLMPSLRELGIRPLLVCPAGPLNQTAHGLGLDVETLDLPPVHLRARIWPSLSPRTLGRLSKLIRTRGVGIIHAESLLGLIYGGIAARASGIPCVASYYGYWPMTRAFRLAYRLLCDRFYAIAHCVADELSGKARLPEEKVRIIPNEINPAFIAELPSQAEARRILGLPADDFIIMQIARFQAIKGQMTMLQAFKHLLAGRVSENRDATVFAAKTGGVPVFQNSKLIFVGGTMGALPDEVEYRHQVECAATEPELRDRVVFLGYRTDIAMLIRAADVIVSPSDYETFGMAVVEAAAVGTPVVATNVGGPGRILSELYGAEADKQLTPPKDPVALARAIGYALTHRDRVEETARMARVKARQTYGPGSKAAALVEEYRQLDPEFATKPALERPEKFFASLRMTGSEGTPRHQEPGTRNQELRTAVSLICTVLDEAHGLLGLLSSLSRQTRLPDEVVVCDGGSTDDTVRILEDFAPTFPRPFRVIRIHGTIAAGRNAAIRAASYPIIACTDAGCEIDPDWLAEIVKPFESDRAPDVAAGFYRTRRETLFEKCGGSLTASTWRARPDTFLPSARSVAFRKSAWAAVGGFREELRSAEDTAFDLALKAHGYRFILAPRAMVTWRPRGSLRQVFRQFRGYASGDAHGQIRARKYLRLSMRYALWVALGIAALITPAHVPLLLLLAFTLVAYWGVWAVHGVRNGQDVRGAAIGPLVKLAMDLGSMVGYVRGILTRRRDLSQYARARPRQMKGATK
jgi:glycosyltransferase involved in cell wall biosynthesis